MDADKRGPKVTRDHMTWRVELSGKCGRPLVPDVVKGWLPLIVIGTLALTTYVLIEKQASQLILLGIVTLTYIHLNFPNSFLCLLRANYRYGSPPSFCRGTVQATHNRKDNRLKHLENQVKR